MSNVILCFTVNVRNWGAERSMCSLCDYLQHQGQKVIVVIPRKGEIINLLNEINVEYIVHPFNFWVCNKRKFVRPDRYVRKFLSEESDIRSIVSVLKERKIAPKLIYSATITFGTGAKLAKILRVPHVQHIRENIDAFNYRFIFGYKFSMRYINKYSKCIICTCNAIRDRYIEDIDSDKTFAIHNGIPVIDILPEKNYSHELRLVQVARFMPDKRVIDTLYSIRELVNRGVTNIQLDIFGEGEEAEEYANFIKQNKLEKVIKLMGFVPHIDFSPYHIGIMSSTFEAFARSTLDYMNNGLAVIASNSGGNLEQVLDSVTGYLYRVCDYNDMADKIETLYNDRTRLKQMGENGRNFFLENFTQEKYTYKVGSKILELIH